MKNNYLAKPEICGKCKHFIIHQFPHYRKKYHQVYCMKKFPNSSKIGLISISDYVAKSNNFKACYEHIPTECVYLLEYVVSGGKDATKES